MKKLMAFDVDGTLLFNRQVEPQTVAAIKRWQDAGYLAVCNTGKSIYANQIAFEPYDIHFDYTVLYTGAVITDGEYTILSKKTLPFDVVERVVDYVSAKNNVSVFATTLDHDYQLSNRTGEISDILPAFSPMDRADLPNHEYVGIPIWSPDAQIRAEIFTWIRQEFGDRLDCHRNLDFLDIVPRGCTKGTGLEWLVEHEFAGEELEIFTIGDSWNDLEMHAIANHAASFTYAPQEVRDAVELVVEKTPEFIDWALKQD